eukprot:PhF_6_TR15448/c0_g1_i1/m.23983
MRHIRKLTSFPYRSRQSFLFYTTYPSLPDNNFDAKNNDSSLLQRNDDLIPRNEIEERIFMPNYKLLRCMMAPSYEDRLIGGVPFKERPLDAFKSHLESPEATGLFRYDLCYNTGPAGSGKTVQLVQCMKIAAEMNFIVFGIEFNGLQPIRDETDFMSAVNARILACALRMKWRMRYDDIKLRIDDINHRIRKTYKNHPHVQKIDRDFETRNVDDVIRDAKRIAVVSGVPNAMEMPVCLVVDEFMQ